MLVLSDKELDRLATKFTAGDGCWDWIAGMTGAGYSEIMVRSKVWSGHRLMYELMIGPIPEGLTIDHLCRNTRCVRPDHLEAVTNRANVLRSESFSAKHARKTHCPQGHPYSPENTYKTRRGSRVCRTCDLARSAARKRRLKQERAA